MKRYHLDLEPVTDIRRFTAGGQSGMLGRATMGGASSFAGSDKVKVFFREKEGYPILRSGEGLDPLPELKELLRQFLMTKVN